MKIFPVEVHCDVTAIKIVNDYVFCGIGSYLKIFLLSTKEQIYFERIFNGATLFQLVFDNDNKHLLAVAEKHLKLFSIERKDVGDKLGLLELSSATSRDWVLAASFIIVRQSSVKHVLTMTMQNTANLWQVNANATNWLLLRTFSCHEKCILYSAFITYNESSDRCVFFAGTVFNTVLIWSCQLFDNSNCDKVTLNTLVGHEGVIFAIDVKEGFVCTTSDDRSSILWQLHDDNNKWSKKCRVYGHSARVFCCKITPSSFVTAGEDGVANVWSFEGNLLQKFVVSQEGQLWQLDYCTKQHILAVGSGNGSLVLFQLNELFKSTAHNKLEMNLNQPPKLMVRFINFNNCLYILSISIDGTQLFLYNNNCKEIILIKSIVDCNLGTSILMETCEDLIALAGRKGDLYIYQLVHIDDNNDNTIGIKSVGKFKPKINIHSSNRLCSLHWLTNKLMIMCMQNGHFTLIYCRNDDSEMPTVVGVYLLPLKSKERWSTCACVIDEGHFVVGDRRGQVHLFSFPNVVGKRETMTPTPPIQSYKVHSYLGINAIYRQSNGLFATIGRDGFVKCLAINNCHCWGHAFREMAENQMPFNWITKYCQSNNRVEGFEGKKFIIYDINERRILFDYNCGGGHRSFDSCLIKNMAHFVYIKNKTVHYVQYNLNHQCNLLGSWHANVVNCLAVLPFNCFISGGEDTTIRLSCQLDKRPFRQLEIIKSHLSSVRCLATRLLDQNTCLVVSGGGRAQIILWKVHLNPNQSPNESKIQLMSSFYEENSVIVSNSETRIMDVEFLHSNIIIAVCSDGSIKIFQFLHHMLTIVHNEQSPKRKCLLKCRVIKSGANLITTATDGYLVFWKITETPSWQLQQLQQIQLHQSGINCCHWKMFNDDNLIGIVTGGDDNAIHFTIFRLEDEQIRILSKFSDCGTHCAQISGCFIYLFDSKTQGLLFTTSKDQKMAVFKWQYDLDEMKTITLKCNKFFIYNTSIADVEGLQIANKTDDIIQVVIYGRGVEFLNINKKDVLF